MSTPVPGQIRCPTCQRSTPPAAFCTQCGTAIPDSARARPRGPDRDQLQDRIRAHRPGDAAFRRGAPASGPEAGPSAYRPFQPEPEDGLVLPGGAADDDAPARVDNTAPDFDQPPPIVTPPPVVAPPLGLEPGEAPAAGSASVVADDAGPRGRQPAPWKAPPPPPPVEPFDAPPPRWAADDDRYAEEPQSARYRSRELGDEWERRGPGIGPLAIGGFVLLGVLAIGVGAFMAGVFSGGAAVTSPSPSQVISAAPSASSTQSVTPSTLPSAGQSVGPTGSIGPVPDDFTATTQPCAEQPASDGCGSSGSTLSVGSLWVWVGWKKGSDADTLGVHIVDSAGADVGTGSIALSTIGANGCGASCNGWARFKFGGLSPGDYAIRVDRNGADVADATFTVNSQP